MIFYYITNKFTWIPLYLYLIYLLYKNYGIKTIIIGFYIGLLFLIADQTSVRLFKEVFERLRPCHNPEIADFVHTLNGKCGGKFGFVSSHATNSFAIAVFSGYLFKKFYKYAMPVLVLWAALVAYSRVYVGVHYPADIIAGGVLGSLVGYLMVVLLKFCNKKFNFGIHKL